MKPHKSCIYCLGGVIHSEHLIKSPSEQAIGVADSLKFARAHVTFDYAKRHYLGEVRDWYLDETTGGTIRLIVHHMNGERWMDPYYPDKPLNPPMRSVEVLDRSWPESEGAE